MAVKSFQFFVMTASAKPPGTRWCVNAQAHWAQQHRPVRTSRYDSLSQSNVKSLTICRCCSMRDVASVDVMEFGRYRVAWMQLIMPWVRSALAAIEHLKDVLNHETSHMTVHSLSYGYHARSVLSTPAAEVHAELDLTSWTLCRANSMNRACMTMRMSSRDIFECMLVPVRRCVCVRA